MTVRHCQVPDNFRPDDGLSGWKRIVAALLIAAAAIARSSSVGAAAITVTRGHA
jgi:hypothetical protein